MEEYACFLDETNKIEFSQMVLNIIYRCCDSINSCSMHKPRIFGLSKHQVISTCLDSLEKAIVVANSKKIDVRLFVIADKCSERLLSRIDKSFPNANVTLLDQNTGGNAKSFCKCVEIASNLSDDDIVFFLEDDYLFVDPYALIKIPLAVNMLRQIDGTEVALTSDDYPDRWNVRNMHNRYCRENSSLRITPIGHFMRIHHTTCTFCMMIKSVKKFYDELIEFRKWPRVNEDMSINRCWKEIHLYQPLPAWTCHFQEDAVIPMYLDRNVLKDFAQHASNL